jgi:phosphotransacetylase
MKSGEHLSQLDIEDVRRQFRNTFSNYPKSKVLKDLENAIYYQKTEEAFFWTGDLLCSGFVLELWNLYVHILCKYIHIQHPKLPLYVYKKFVEFKEMVQACPNDLELRNMDSVKTLLFSMTLILSETKKQTLLDPMTFKFKFEEVFTDLRAPNLEYVVPFFREGDPKELFIPLNEFVYHSGMIMKPVFSQAKMAPKRIVFAEGEDERVLRAVQVIRDEAIARPILIGRPSEINRRIEAAGLRIREGEDFEVVYADNCPFFDEHFEEFWTTYHGLMERKGVSPDYAKREVRRRATLYGSLMVRLGYADGLICGTFGRHETHREYVQSVIGTREGLDRCYAMNLLMLPGRTVFIGDTYVNYDPTAEQLADMTLLAAEEIRNFGIQPKVALLSHSTFGTEDTPTSIKMRQVLANLQARAPELEVEGEMHGDAALDEQIRLAAFPNSRLKGQANLLVMPTLDAANISFNLLKVAAGDNLTVGPILLGAAKPVNVLTPTATVRRIVNMTALTVVDAV